MLQIVIVYRMQPSCAITGSQDVQSRWLLAQCCMSMNKYTEAEQALNPNNDGTDVSIHAFHQVSYVLPSMCWLKMQASRLSNP